MINLLNSHYNYSFVPYRPFFRSSIKFSGNFMNGSYIKGHISSLNEIGSMIGLSEAYGWREEII